MTHLEIWDAVLSCPSPASKIKTISYGTWKIVKKWILLIIQVKIPVSSSYGGEKIGYLVLNIQVAEISLHRGRELYNYPSGICGTKIILI